MIGSVFALEVLLFHYYSTGGNFPRYDAPIYPQEIRVLLESGMLQSISGGYRTTEKANFYIAHILHLPFPVAKFEIPGANND